MRIAHFSYSMCIEKKKIASLKFYANRGKWCCILNAFDSKKLLKEGYNSGNNYIAWSE